MSTDCLRLWKHRTAAWLSERLYADALLIYPFGLQFLGAATAILRLRTLILPLTCQTSTGKAEAGGMCMRTASPSPTDKEPALSTTYNQRHKQGIPLQQEELARVTQCHAKEVSLQGHCLVGSRMISEAFPNLNDSMILLFPMSLCPEDNTQSANQIY